jgi:hypothetical protein
MEKTLKQLEPERITLTLKPLRDTQPLTSRLRRLLKFALRSCGLRCVAIRNGADS